MNHCKGKTVLPRWPQFCFLFPWLSQKAFLLLACCCCCEPRNRFSHFPHVHQFLSETPVLFCKASAHVVLPNCLHNYFLLAKSGDCTIVAIQSMRCSSFLIIIFQKMVQSWPLFCLFSSFPHYNFNHTNWKSVDGCCSWYSNPGPQDGRDRETTELWRPPSDCYLVAPTRENTLTSKGQVSLYPLATSCFTCCFAYI